MARRMAVTVVVSLLVLSGSVRQRVQAETADTELIWDVRDTGQIGQLSIYNADGNGALLGMPVGSGDLDGDGFDDVVLAPFYAPSGPSNVRNAAGKLHIYFGNADPTGIIDTGDAQSGVVSIWGARTGDFLGDEVDVADVTGDGLEDILACAQNSDGFPGDNSRTQAGALYIIRGRTNWGAGPIDLANFTDGVTMVLGANPSDRLGFWATAGDVNGDGIKDILVSADLASGAGGAGQWRGRLYIIPGGASLPNRIDLANQTHIDTLGIVTVFGIDDFDHLGSCIASGDFDGDGLDDIAVSAGVSRSGAGFTGFNEFNGALGTGGGDGPSNSRSNCGEAYVIYGRGSWPATINLARPPADVSTYYGDDNNDYFGEDVRAGDLDGDGRDELVIGALLANAPNPSRTNSGIGYIYWSSMLQRGETVDTRSLQDSPRLTRLYGENPGDIGADTVLIVDIDGDSYDDVLFGSPINAPLGRSGAGDLKVLYGSPTRFPPVVDLRSPGSVEVYQIIAADANDMFTYSLTHGDVNGDGIEDLIPNSMGGDGLANRHIDAGEAYVISGKTFSERVGRMGTTPPVVSRFIATPQAEMYYAGQSGIQICLFCDSTDPDEQFQEGAIAVVRGVEIPTTFVSATQICLSLDDVPAVRNVAGNVTVQVRNPGSGPSAPLDTIELIGPLITELKVKDKDSGFNLTVKGENFLDDATVTVTDSNGAQVTPVSVTRPKKKKLKVVIAEGAVAPGSSITVIVWNPGPASSNVVTAVAP